MNIVVQTGKNKITSVQNNNCRNIDTTSKSFSNDILQITSNKKNVFEEKQ